MLTDLLKPSHPRLACSTINQSLDSLLGNIKPGSLVAVAGEPLAGKSWWVRNVLSQHFLNLMASHDVLSGEVEMPSFPMFIHSSDHLETMMEMILENLTNTTALGEPVPDSDIESLTQMAAFAFNQGLHILPHSELSPDHIDGAVRALLSERPVGMVVVDQFESLSIPGFTGTEAEQRQLIASKLKTIAADTGVSLLVTTSTPEDAGDHPSVPSIDPALFGYADRVLTVYRQCLADLEASPRIELGVAKPVISEQDQRKIRAHNASHRPLSLDDIISQYYTCPNCKQEDEDEAENPHSHDDYEPPSRVLH